MEKDFPFNSHYVPLNPPFPILYYRGRVGIQTGSLIVVRPPLRGGNSNALKMVSMPVVTYANKSKRLPGMMAMSVDWAENNVWQTDVSGTELLGYDNAEAIDLFRFSSVERLRNMTGMSAGFSLVQVVHSIKNLGFQIAPDFYPANPHGSLELMYGHLDPITPCLTSNHIQNLSSLFIAVNVFSKSHKEIFTEICNQVEDYKSAVGRADITIQFRCKEPQFAELIDQLNAKYASQ